MLFMNYQIMLFDYLFLKKQNFLFILFVCLFMCVRVGGHTGHRACVEGWKTTCKGQFFSFYHTGPGALTHDIRLGRKYLYPLDHLAGPGMYS